MESIYIERYRYRYIYIFLADVYGDETVDDHTSVGKSCSYTGNNNMRN